MYNKSFVILFVVILLGIMLRFYQLGDIPIGFHRDEAFLGYNAYSILHTGRDMNGNFLPLHLESFLYSPAGYSYFSIPFIWVFGLSAFSVRFAAASFGVLTIIFTYILTIKLFPSFKFKEILGLLSAFLLAVSPWHINLSRTATENSIVVFFITAGVLLSLYFFEKKKIPFLLLSFLSFGITFFIYQAPRAFLPIFIPLLFLLFRDRISKNQQLLVGVLFFFIIVIPLLAILMSATLSLRIRTVSVFNSSETQLIIDDMSKSDGVHEVPFMITRLFHNKVIAYGQLLLQNYFKHISYDFLFTDQAYPLRYKIPLVGIMYIVELPLLLLGIWRLIQKEKKASVLLLGWILISFIGPAFTYDDVPNVQRTLIVFPALSILIAYGLLAGINLFSKHYHVRFFALFGIGIAFIFCVSFYLHQYYTHASLYQPWHRNDGYKLLVESVNKYLPTYKKAIVTNRESAPTIFSLFYNAYNPQSFQKETKNSILRDFDRVSFGKFEFSQEECPARIEKTPDGIRRIGEKNVLYVNSGLCKEFVGFKTLKIIERVDGSAAFRIVALQ